MSFVSLISAGLMLLTDNTHPTLQLVTEENHPYSYTDKETGELIGASVEMIQLLMKNADVSYSLMVLPRKRALRLAEENPNVCMFSVNKTPARLNRFEWVGPLVEGGWGFFSKPGSTYNIKSLQDLKNYTVTGTDGTASIEMLRNNSDAKIITSNSDEGAIAMLYHGRADFLLTGVIEIKPTTKSLGYEEPQLSYLWRKSHLALACAKGTDKTIIKRLNDENTKIATERFNILQKHLQ
ncbi:substrate-binding periplasmic protein [Kordiimonas laminariae]|uniref:substrate-binding periplasmic protein n=1 Tax=Kordiimonas laminariae TaxID=2917717 RepID=UPI001FF33A5A|nr:ABC transporter substrate-binding protein [Kordiimonas laminariae]MCK0068749.1 ABC transporter substrate-binding protein [Kordiimonas laminariae]